MKFPNNTKAIVAAIIAALGPVATDATTNPQGVTTGTGVVSVIAAALGYGVTWYARNGSKGGVQGLVVTLKTDADVFLAQLVAGLPDLVKSAAMAALKKPEPVATIGELVAMKRPEPAAEPAPAEAPADSTASAEALSDAPAAAAGPDYPAAAESATPAQPPVA